MTETVVKTWDGDLRPSLYGHVGNAYLAEAYSDEMTELLSRMGI